MQKILEPILHIMYITPIIILGSYLIRNAVGNILYKAFGSFSLTLALADGIFLIPRMYALLTTGIEDNLKIIGWGRMGNAIIISILFLVLYDIYNLRYSKRKLETLNKTFFGLAITRIIICLLPGNKWFELTPSPTFALIRFIPLAVTGILLIMVIYIHSKKYNDFNFKIISVATAIAIIFMEPYMYSIEGARIIFFTLLRTLALLTIIFIGYKELRDINVLSRY